MWSDISKNQIPLFSTVGALSPSHPFSLRWLYDTLCCSAIKRHKDNSNMTFLFSDSPKQPICPNMSLSEVGSQADCTGSEGTDHPEPLKTSSGSSVKSSETGGLIPRLDRHLEFCEGPSKSHDSWVHLFHWFTKDQWLPNRNVVVLNLGIRRNNWGLRGKYRSILLLIKGKV